MRKTKLTAADLRKMARLYKDGYGYRAIGHKLGVHYQTVRDNLLKMTIYTTPPLSPDKAGEKP